MGRIRFWQNTVCKGAGLIRKELRDRGYSSLRLKQSGSRFHGRRGDIIINWGSQRDIPSSVVGNATVFNPPSNIYSASNKLTTFNKLRDAGMVDNLPLFTNDIDVAREWAESEMVYCRTRLQSSKGRGIVIAEVEDEVVEAPLYTQAVDVGREIRIHIFNGEVITFAQKKRMGSERLEDEGIEVNPLIRNYDNGYIFAREAVEIPDEAKEIALRALEVLGLQHASVDMALTEDDETPIIFEINTASGMQGTTVGAYADAIEEWLRNSI